MDALQRCVGDVEDFATTAWGALVRVREPSPAGYTDLLSLDDVDRMMSEHGLRTPAFRLVRDGRPLPASEYTRSARLGGQPMSGIADPARIFAAFDQGATIVLQGLQRYWSPVAAFCRELEVALGHQCQVNAYITPPGAQGFREHSDAHDVFVLQAFGRKEWQIGSAPGERHAADDGQVSREVHLTPGTAVYMPAGTRHAARTQHSVSGHLTVGIHPTRWRDAVEEALARALDDSSLDTPLPVGFHRDPCALAPQVSARLRELITRLDKLDSRSITETLAERFLTRRPARLRGGLTDRVRLSALSDDGRIRRRAGAVCEVRVSESSPLRVLLGDRELRIPRWVEPAMRDIAARDEFAVRDLAPYLDATSRLVLVRRLVREGLLEVTNG